MDLSGEMKVREVLSESFGMSCGLRQGCVLSPLLFSLYVNSLVEKLKVAGVGMECRGRLVTVCVCIWSNNSEHLTSFCPAFC